VNANRRKEIPPIAGCSCGEKARNAVARVNGCFVEPFGGIPEDANKILPFLGKCICFYSGGEVPEEFGKNADHVTANTIMARLKELGVIR